jgi:hypothetical protein
MSVLTRVTATPPPPYAVATAPAPDEPRIEIKSSKTREERRHVHNGRRPSIHRDGWERYTERRGSKDDARRKSLVDALMKARRESLSEKQEVLVIVAARQWDYQL